MRSQLSNAIVGVIGPPGAGKSTIIATLAPPAGLPVFRLREAIRDYSDVLAGLPPSKDPLGWVSCEAIDRILRAAFLDHRFIVDDGPVLMDNFPGTARQLEQLVKIAVLVGRRLALLELRAETPTVDLRVAQRRVCSHCGPDLHTPAKAAKGDHDRCSVCGAKLRCRDSDIPKVHKARLARYHANAPEIAELALNRHIPHLTICADHEVRKVCCLARRAFDELTAIVPRDSANHSGSRP